MPAGRKTVHADERVRGDGCQAGLGRHRCRGGLASGWRGSDRREVSRPGNSDARDWAPALAALQSTTSLSTMQDQEFDLIFLPGGHGPLVDLATDATLQAPAS